MPGRPDTTTLGPSDVLPTSSWARECPRQESNLVYDLRRIVCASATLRGQETPRHDEVVRTSSVQGETPVGIEPTSPGLQPVAWPSGSSVLSSIPAGIRTRI